MSKPKMIITIMSLTLFHHRKTTLGTSLKYRHMIHHNKGRQNKKEKVKAVQSKTQVGSEEQLGVLSFDDEMDIKPTTIIMGREE